MAYDKQLAQRLRTYLNQIPSLPLEEKKMFGGLAFMVDGKMCINVSKNRLMCRINPDDHDELAKRPGVENMVMHGKPNKGFCFVLPEGYEDDSDFSFWVETCLAYNPLAKSSKSRK